MTTESSGRSHFERWIFDTKHTKRPGFKMEASCQIGLSLSRDTGYTQETSRYKPYLQGIIQGHPGQRWSRVEAVVLRIQEKSVFFSLGQITSCLKAQTQRENNAIYNVWWLIPIHHCPRVRDVLCSGRKLDIFAELIYFNQAYLRNVMRFCLKLVENYITSFGILINPCTTSIGYWQTCFAIHFSPRCFVARWW